MIFIIIFTLISIFTSILISLRLSKIFRKLMNITKNKKCKVFSSILYTTNQIFAIINSAFFVTILFILLKYPERLSLTVSSHIYLFIALMILLERILFWYMIEIKNGWH